MTGISTPLIFHLELQLSWEHAENAPSPTPTLPRTPTQSATLTLNCPKMFNLFYAISFSARFNYGQSSSEGDSL